MYSELTKKISFMYSKLVEEYVIVQLRDHTRLTTQMLFLLLHNHIRLYIHPCGYVMLQNVLIYTLRNITQP